LPQKLKAAALEEHFKAFRDRRLDDQQWPHLIVDATYVKVRRRGRRRDAHHAHQGISAALTPSLTGVSWQGCRVYFMRNALAAVGNKDKEVVGRESRELFKIEDRSAAWARRRRWRYAGR